MNMECRLVRRRVERRIGARPCDAAVRALLFGASDTQHRHDETGASWLAADDAKIDEELAGQRVSTRRNRAVAATLEVYRHAASYRRLDEAGRRRLHVILDRLLKAAANFPGLQPWCNECCACWRPSAPARRTWLCSRSSPPP